jgi:hypothetical protein
VLLAADASEAAVLQRRLELEADLFLDRQSSNDYNAGLRSRTFARSRSPVGRAESLAQSWRLLTKAAGARLQPAVESLWIAGSQQVGQRLGSSGL